MVAYDFKDEEKSSINDPGVLRVQSLFDSPKTHKYIKGYDVTLYDIEQEAWDYSRGARTVREYHVGGVLYVRHVYSYTMTNGNRDIATINHTFEWLNNDGTVGASKPRVKKMTPKSLGEMNTEVREGRMTDLRENAKTLPGDPANGIPSGQEIISMIYAWYGDLIADYEATGSMDLENALKGETDPARLAVLNFSITAFGGLTIMQLLAFQLVGAYTWPS